MKLQKYTDPHGDMSKDESGEFYKASEVDALIVPVREVWERWQDRPFKSAEDVHERNVDFFYAVKKVME